MKTVVDQDTCTGCGLCVNTCPDVFELDGDKAKVRVDEVPEDAQECTRQAAADCPMESITVND